MIPHYLSAVALMLPPLQQYSNKYAEVLSRDTKPAVMNNYPCVRCLNTMDHNNLKNLQITKNGDARDSNLFDDSIILFFLVGPPHSDVSTHG